MVSALMRLLKVLELQQPGCIIDRKNKILWLYISLSIQNTTPIHQ